MDIPSKLLTSPKLEKEVRTDGNIIENQQSLQLNQ